MPKTAGPARARRSGVRRRRRSSWNAASDVQSSRYAQQDLAAAQEMLHRILDVLEGVHACHGDSEGAVGYQGRRLTNDRYHLVAVVEVADKESPDGQVLGDQYRGVDPHGFVPGPGVP